MGVFGKNDKVIARGFAFWLTVTHAENGWYECCFGATNRYAGKFRGNELSMYQG